MFKTNSLNFVTPLVRSSSSTASVQVRTVRQPVRGLVQTSRTYSRGKFMQFANVELFSLVGLILFGTLLALHVYWINTYSAKGFELKRAQSAIEDQTNNQKKLLVQQSLLSSTSAIANAQATHLVPITEVEYVSGNNFAQAK